MATTTVSRNDLVGLTSLSFIRPIKLTYNISGTKPGTRLYAFFDGKSVDQYITPNGGTLGQAVITSASGTASGTFDIPPRTFNTGDRLLKFQDSLDINALPIPGSTSGHAEAIFSSTGLLQTFRQTIDNTTVEERNVVQPRPTPPVVFRPRSNDDSGGSGDGGDPLAQTFFTYGIKGGCFITKLDVYFQSKDASIPVRVEIRNAVNGYPGPGSAIVSKDAFVELSPSSINLSNNASVATTFTFPAPVYLEEDKDYCFVLLSNSNSYNVWTSEMGAKSIETGNTIFDQPHIGSLFKSENNVTWTAEQTQDIKFTLYKAKFDTTEREIVFKTNAQPILLMGANFAVTNLSAVVTVTFDCQHGFKTGDKIYLTAQTGATYRGITAATLSNAAGFSVTKVNDYSITFNAGTNATSTGTLATSGILNAVEVDAGGSGYVSPTITITGNGSGATATPVVVGGKIVSVTVNTPGSGYTEPPSYTINAVGGGSGAILYPISEGIFVARINRLYQSAAPIMSILEPPQTNTVTTFRSSNWNTYSLGTHTIRQLNETQSVGNDAVLATPQVETASFGGNATTQMIVRMSSANANVSPMIDLSDAPPRLQLHNMIVNSVANAASETSPTAGTSYARYISKPVALETVSIGAKVFVNAASVSTTSFDVFIRTSLSTSGANHTVGDWVKMDCLVDRSLSTTIENFLDYEFTKEGLSPFDVYDIKIVLSSPNKYMYPIINNYRVIILAT